jgi:hypothetical protein
MRTTTTLWLGLALCGPLLSACPRPTTVDAPVDPAIRRHLAGTWVGANGAEVLITYAGGEHVVQSVVDGDGEVFQVMRSGWTSEGYTFDYLVPSSSYQVHTVVLAASAEALDVRWSNDHGADGTEILRRKP